MSSDFLSTVKIADLTEIHISKLRSEGYTTADRISRRQANELAELLGCSVPVAEDLLDFAKTMSTVPNKIEPSVQQVQVSLVNPKDLTDQTDLEIATAFADVSQRRLTHLQSEFARRTGGKIVVGANGEYLLDHNVSLMSRVTTSGAYTAAQYTIYSVTGFCQRLSTFVQGMKPLCSPFSGEPLDSDGNDPSTGLIFPLQSMDQMLQLAWIAQNGSNIVDFRDVDEIFDIVQMISGEIPQTRKIKRLVEGYKFAVSTKNRDLLNKSEELLYGRKLFSSEDVLRSSQGLNTDTTRDGLRSVSIGGNAGGATIITGDSNVHRSSSPDPFTAAVLVAQNKPLSTDDKAAIVVKLRSYSPQRLAEVFQNGGAEFAPASEIDTAKFLQAFYIAGQGYSAERSPEREDAINLFRAHASENHWRQLKVAIAKVDQRISSSRI